MKMMIYLKYIGSFVGKLYRKTQKHKKKQNRIERKEKERKIFSQNGLNMMMMMPWRLSSISSVQRNGFNWNFCSANAYKQIAMLSSTMTTATNQFQFSNRMCIFIFFFFSSFHLLNIKHKTHIMVVSEWCYMKCRIKIKLWMHKFYSRHSPFSFVYAMEKSSPKESRQPFRSRCVVVI